MKIDKSLKLNEILKIHKSYGDYLSDYGMDCCNCPLNGEETLEEACILHGLSTSKILEKLSAIK